MPQTQLGELEIKALLSLTREANIALTALTNHPKVAHLFAIEDDSAHGEALAHEEATQLADTLRLIRNMQLSARFLMEAQQQPEPCSGTYYNGPGKKYVRCDACGHVDYECNEGDTCRRS